MSFVVRRKAGPLLSILPLLAVPGLGLLGLMGGAGHFGQELRHAALSEARPDAPMPTAPLAERVAYTRELHRRDLRTFQAKIDYWQAAAQAPGAAGQHAQQKLAQWRQMYRKSQATLQRQTQEAAAPL